ncbi:MAG TPA: pilus assembly protein TadG-related protein [Allosphingosinicella sp.]|jgi:Flp pilus assembly protein TadG
MRALSWIRDLLSSERGNVLVVGAAALPLLLGAVALSVDSVNLTLARRQLQRTADSGALAGAYAIVQNQTVATAVNRDLALNKDHTLKTTTIENAPTAGTHKNDTSAVRVILTANRATPFMAIFNDRTPTIRVEATAAVIFNGKFCMVSLEDGNTTGITFTGSSTVDLGCGVATNSRATTGIACSGSTRVVASPIAAVGGVPTCSGYATGTKLMPFSAKQTDPFASLPVPDISGMDCSAQIKIQPNDALTTKQPGCYKDMDIKGKVNLAPGTYYINGATGAFSAGSQAVISCTGCTIILTSKTPSISSTIATVSINGGAQLNMSAPKTGTYGGVLMYQDPRATLGNSIQINGNSLTSYEGAFYFPKAYMTFNGTTGMNTQCLQLVARRLAFSGNSSVTNTCPSDTKSGAFDATFVRLVA